MKKCVRCDATEYDHSLTMSSDGLVCASPSSCSTYQAKAGRVWKGVIAASWDRPRPGDQWLPCEILEVKDGSAWVVPIFADGAKGSPLWVHGDRWRAGR